jgi:hypothetical protein
MNEAFPKRYFDKLGLVSIAKVLHHAKPIGER